VDDVEHSIIFRDRPHKLRSDLRKGDLPLREPEGEVSELSMLFFPSPFRLTPPTDGGVMNAPAAHIFHGCGKPVANGGIIRSAASSCDRRRLVYRHVVGMRVMIKLAASKLIASKSFSVSPRNC
jgi:hypothetical protein